MIYTVKTLQEILAQLPKITANDLIIFDIHFVIVRPVGNIWHLSTRSFRTFRDRLWHDMSDDEHKYLWSIALQSMPFNLIDPSIPDFIANIRSHNAIAMAHTNMLFGQFGTIAKMADWRHNNLQKNGIDFSPIFCSHNPSTLSIGKDEALFQKGILFSPHHEKGLALSCFLDHIEYQPNQIIFIDDTKKNLSSIEKHMGKRNIPFTGFHYTASPRIASAFDSTLATFQLNYLRTHEQWISDKDAYVLMNNKHTSI